MKNKYSLLTNEELVELVKEEDDKAFSEIRYRFSRFIKFKSRFLSLNSDLNCNAEHEALSALYMAVLSFSPTTEASFASYASHYISGHLKKVFEDMTPCTADTQNSTSYDEAGDNFEAASEVELDEKLEAYVLKSKGDK